MQPARVASRDRTLLLVLAWMGAAVPALAIGRRFRANDLRALGWKHRRGLRGSARGTGADSLDRDGGTFDHASWIGIQAEASLSA